MNITENQPSATIDVVENEHGPIYWLFANTSKTLLSFGRSHKKTSLVLLTTIAWLIFLFRAHWQPYVVLIREHSPEVLAMAIFFVMTKFFWKHRHYRPLVARMTLGYILFVSCVSFWSLMVYVHFKMDLPPLRHLTLYLRYNELDPVKLTELPETDHERIQPLNSIRVLGSEAMKEVEQVSEPHFIRNLVSGTNQFRWAMGIEPTYAIPRFFGHIKEIFDVNALVAQPNFSGESRVPVSFRVGEGLSWGKKTRVAVIRSLGPMRFFSYSPADIRYMKDDQGKWVEVVSLIRWRGIIFVWPEFGGVQVIHQENNSLAGIVRSWFCGDGEWIRPENLHEYNYLREQNTVPYMVSRYMAHSLRFQNGFTDPLPMYHQGDTRIPDLPGDQNDQPFCVFFKFGSTNSLGSNDKLYHYFALEPYHETKQGLNTSVFIPADGVGRVKIFQHFKINEALTGVSAISAKVMESRKQYDWEQSRPAEHRPFIRDIQGKRRFFWLTTVVTYKDKKHVGEQGFIAGSTPGVTLTDAKYKPVVWVDPNAPSKWTDQLKDELSTVWSSN